LTLAGLREVIGAVADGELSVVHHAVDSPTPLAFGLATLVDSDTVLADDESAVLREFHARVMEEVGEADTEHWDDSEGPTDR